MNEDKCCLLIGNSRWHWAIQNKGIWGYFHTSPEEKRLINIKERLWKWAAVGRIPKNVDLDPKREVKIKNITLQKIPPWLGIDRALGSWGAFKKAKANGMHSKGLLIADAGTVLSINKITANGEFAGGQLSAGLNLQRSAMSNNTQKLKKPRNENLPKIIFPLTTEEAILRGTFQSLLGCLIEAQKETEMPVWLCGGDSKIIFEHLKNRMEIIHCPNIVLEAMIEITL